MHLMHSVLMASITSFEEKVKIRVIKFTCNSKIIGNTVVFLDSGRIT